MNTWITLQKELSYYGIRVIKGKRCQLYKDGKSLVTQGIVRTVRQLEREIEKQKSILFSLWEDIADLLQREEGNNTLMYDERMIDLFIFSLKDLSKFLMCFDDMENSEFSQIIDNSLSKDISSFSKEQISKLPDYKISVDWTHRLIGRLMYVVKLLSYVLMGADRISALDIKEARGVSGPWSRLDLPMEERKYPFEQIEMDKITQDKQHQRRYTNSLATYNNDGRVGNGYYWREIRNEPFSWDKRGEEDPYPSRHTLSRWG
jgi:hypothetical protein